MLLTFLPPLLVTDHIYVLNSSYDWRGDTVTILSNTLIIGESKEGVVLETNSTTTINFGSTSTSESTYTTGTITATIGTSFVVTGSGTSWSSNVSAGDVLVPTLEGDANAQYMRVEEVVSNTKIRLTSPAGYGYSGASYRIVTNAAVNIHIKNLGFRASTSSDTKQGATVKLAVAIYCSIDNCNLEGWWTVAPYATALFKFVNNICRGSKEGVFRNGTLTKSLISNNIVSGGAAFISVCDPSLCVISNNIITGGNSLDGNNGEIDLTSGSDRNVIAHNIFSGNNGYAIKIASGCTKNLIANNIIYKNGGAISDAGTGSVIDNNITS